MIGTAEQDIFLRTHSLAVVTTLRSDGSPCNVVCFTTCDGDELIFSGKSTRLTTLNLQRDPRISVTVLSEDKGCSYVTIDGHARIQYDGIAPLQLSLGRVRPDYTVPPSETISAEQMAQIEHLYKSQKRLIVRVIPQRVVGIPDRALWRRERDNGTWQVRRGWPKDP